MNRRHLLFSLGSAFLGVSSLAAANTDHLARPLVRIALSPTCGCCKEWVAHLQQSGFETSVEEVPEINRRKTAARIPTEFWSCHTAFVAGYFIEGHVPADDIRRLLNAHPDARGLAVPGMPVGSPGMEMPGTPADRYRTLLIGMNNRATVWAEH
jgi:hypothetical protein